MAINWIIYSPYVNFTFYFSVIDRNSGSSHENGPNVRYGLRNGDVVMTISGREQVPSDDYRITDPYILPVHMYREPPPSYSQVATLKTQTSRQELTSHEEPPSYDDTHSQHV